jgi:hypothetical protein
MREIFSRHSRRGGEQTNAATQAIRRHEIGQYKGILVSRAAERSQRCNRRKRPEVEFTVRAHQGSDVRRCQKCDHDLSSINGAAVAIGLRVARSRPSRFVDLVRLFLSNDASRPERQEGRRHGERRRCQLSRNRPTRRRGLFRPVVVSAVFPIGKQLPRDKPDDPTRHESPCPHLATARFSRPSQRRS